MRGLSGFVSSVSQIKISTHTHLKFASFPLNKSKKKRGRPPTPYHTKLKRFLISKLTSFNKNFGYFGKKISSLKIHKSKILKQKYLALKKAYNNKTRTVVVFKAGPSRLFKKIKNKKYYLFALAILSIPFVILFYIQIIKDLPSPSRLATDKPIVSTKIYDRNGILLYKIYKNENRSIVNLDQIPATLQQATISIEDKDFYEHSGFSIKGILRAFKSNLTNDTLQGGSTITQQLIKNTLLTQDRNITRKIKELILSVLTEFYFSKNEILEMYFNHIPYGSTAYGAEEASQMYFGKSVQNLDLSESAFLAGLPAAPTKFSPYGTQPEFAVIRQHEVLRRMVEDGHISLAEAEEAKTKKIVLKPQHNDISAPHFVMYIKELLVEKYGLALVEQGGLEVYTSLDLNTQYLAEQVIKTEVSSLKRLNVTNGAGLVIKPQTGEIISMVGSVNYFDSLGDGQVNVTLRPRQPGSSIKPINYAAALEKGFTPATLIPDTPICYRLPGQPDYCPKNYDGRFHGLVTLRAALANSYNIPAVKTLSQIGVQTMIEKGKAMGINSWEDSSRFGLSLTLGGGEVKMTELATAYAVFANNGLKIDLHPILEVRTYDGRVLEKLNCKNLDIQFTPSPIIDENTKISTCNGTEVLKPSVAYQITNILSDNRARAPAFGLGSVLNIPGHQVAVKTGTTNSLRDNWTVGYTSNHLVATWVGNNDNTSMSYIASGITGASPIWQKIMLYLLKDQPPHLFSIPTGLVKVRICAITGSLACNGCPSTEEYFTPGTEPKNSCTSTQIETIKNNLDKLNRGRDRLLQGTSTQQ